MTKSRWQLLKNRMSTVRISKKKTIMETCDVDKTMIADDLSKHVEGV